MANDIADPAKKRAILLNAAGPATYRLVKTLAIPGKPTDLSFDEIVEKVKTHFNQKPSPIIKRYEFNTRKQQPTETVSEYVAALRRIAEHCEYGSTLNDMLRDRLVCGIADKQVQDRFLCESKLTYKEALEMALAAGTAVRDSQKLWADNGATPVVAPHREEATVQQISKDRTTRSRPTVQGEGQPHHTEEVLATESLNVTGVVVSMTPPGVASKTTNATIARKRGTWLPSVAKRSELITLRQSKHTEWRSHLHK